MRPHIRKYAINYARSFPDHRIFTSDKVDQNVKVSPLTAFRIWKSGFPAAMVEDGPIFLSLFLCFVMLGAGLYATKWGKLTIKEVLPYKKQNKTSMRWGLLSEDKSMGRYDNVLHKFEGEKGGIRDYV